MKERTFYTILPFMVNDLKLSGNELLIYAIIYGFSQDGESWFYGSREYLSECTNISTNSVTRCLQALVKKGYVERVETRDKNGRHTKYRDNTQNKKLVSLKQETCLNNKDNNYLSKEPGKSGIEGTRLKCVWSLTDNPQPHWTPNPFDIAETIEPPFAVKCLKVFNDATGWDMPSMPAKASECLNLRADRYSLEDVGGMVRMKREQWSGTKIERNLKPSTLFSPEHFDEYMQEYLHQNDERAFSDDEIPY